MLYIRIPIMNKILYLFPFSLISNWISHRSNGYQSRKLCKIFLKLSIILKTKQNSNAQGCYWDSRQVFKQNKNILSLETYQGVTESDTTAQLMYTQDIALNFLNFSTQHQTKHKPRLLMLFSYLFACVCTCVCMLSCVWLCDPTDCSPPASTAYGIFQARILEWVAISNSRRSSQGLNPHHLCLLH